MKPAAILSVLACGLAAALWLRLSPEVGWEPGVGLVVGSLASGFLLDRGWRKAALVTGLALFSTALWGMVALPAAWQWTLCAGVLGVGAGMSFLATNVTIAASTAGSRAAVLNLLALLLPVGVLFNPLVRAEVVMMAATATATLALAFAAWAPMPPAASRPQEGGASVSRLAAVLFLYSVCEAATWNWTVQYMRTVRVLDRDAAWTVLSYGLPLGLIVGRIGTSRMLRNVAPLKVMRIASFAMAFTTALMLLARSPSASWVGAFLVGVAMSAILPTTLAVPRSAIGMSIVLAGGFAGWSASTPLIAWVADGSSLPTAMLLLPVLSLGMALLLWGSQSWLQPPFRRPLLRQRSTSDTPLR